MLDSAGYAVTLRSVARLGGCWIVLDTQSITLRSVARLSGCWIVLDTQSPSGL